MAAVMLCTGVFASVAPANHQGSVVPLFCGSHTIPGGTELVVRMGWAVKNEAQARIFLANQKLTWTVSGGDQATVSHVPSPEYGEVTGWTGPVYQEVLAEGKRQKVWLSNYLAPTGVIVGVGETVTVGYTLTASAKTDDGFGNRFNAFETISSGSTCTVTGV
ncbi:MAG TPA: hypothetical protein VIQ02_00955 [Jiangellaceae bacterium]